LFTRREVIMLWRRKLARCSWLATATVAGLFALGQFVLVIFTFTDDSLKAFDFFKGITEHLLVAGTILFGVSFVMYLAELLIQSSKEREEKR
jgi:hypothetical protein